MVSIAINEFGINQFDNINLINADAIDYLEKCKNIFDLIIVDIFIADVIPELFIIQKFMNSLFPRLNLNSKIIYNTMRQIISSDFFDRIKSEFLMGGLEVNVL